MAKHFFVCTDYTLKDRDQDIVKLQGKYVFMAVIFAPHLSVEEQVPDWVTSWSKFISKSSFVDPAQTIKGAAAMTSA